MNRSYCSFDPPTRHILLHDLMVMAHIGAFPEERGVPQRVRINVDMGVDDTGEDERAQGVENLDGVVNYALIVQAIDRMVQEGHIVLVETLAERIARYALALDERVQVVRVRVEKPDIFPHVAGAGVEIERRRLVHHKG